MQIQKRVMKIITELLQHSGHSYLTVTSNVYKNKLCKTPLQYTLCNRLGTLSDNYLHITKQQQKKSNSRLSRKIS